MNTQTAQSRDRWMALIARGAYLLTYLQAVEAETLPTDGPVVVDVQRDRDEYGFPRVDLLCADRDILVAYVREHWGDEEDPEWFQTYVLDRIEWVPANAKRSIWDELLGRCGHCHERKIYTQIGTGIERCAACGRVQA